MTDPLEPARSLARAGMPLYVGRLRPDGRPLGWDGWERTPADGWERRLARWRPGMGIGAVCGTAYDVLDIDPRNGGLESWRELCADLGWDEADPPGHWRVATPSGGRHVYIPALGLPKAPGFLRGIDYLGGLPDGDSRAFAYMPPTERPSAVDGIIRPYRALTGFVPLNGHVDPTWGELAAYIQDRASSAREGTRRKISEENTELSELPDDRATPGRLSITELKERCLGAVAGTQRTALCQLFQEYQRRGYGRDEIAEHVAWFANEEMELFKSERWTLRDMRSMWDRDIIQDASPEETVLLGKIHGWFRKTRARRGRPRRRPESPAGFRLTPASEIEPRPTFWLWDGKIPLGELTITAGHGDVGKSSFNMWLISQVTRGTLPGRLSGQPRPCIIGSPEDSWERTIWPRLMAAGADMKMVHRLDVVTEEGGGLALTLPRDYGVLEEAIRSVQAGIVFFDALMGAIDISLDSHKARDARVAIQPLGEIADRCDCAVIGNAHLNKSPGDPVSRILGSAEFRNVPRAVLMFAKDRDGMRVMSPSKNNLGTEWPSLAYDIEDASFRRKGVDFHPGRFVLGGESYTTAQDVLAEAERARKAAGREQAGCAQWLEQFLEENGGEHEAGKVLSAAAAEGYTERNVQYHRKQLGIVTVKAGGPGTPWMWRLEQLRIEPVRDLRLLRLWR